MAFETALTMEASSIKFGPGVTREVGYEMARLGAHRVMVVTDPNLTHSEAVSVALGALRAEGIDAVLYDRARVEPTDSSFKEAIQFAVDGQFDGYVGIGGGSSMDTAKVADLYATYPADLMAYVNAPIGQGRPVPGPLKPLIAIPTTAATYEATSATLTVSGLASDDTQVYSVSWTRVAAGFPDASGTADAINTPWQR